MQASLAQPGGSTNSGRWLYGSSSQVSGPEGSYRGGSCRQAARATGSSATSTIEPLIPTAATRVWGPEPHDCRRRAVGGGSGRSGTSSRWSVRSTAVRRTPAPFPGGRHRRTNRDGSGRNCRADAHPPVAQVAQGQSWEQAIQASRSSLADPLCRYQIVAVLPLTRPRASRVALCPEDLVSETTIPYPVSESQPAAHRGDHRHIHPLDHGQPTSVAGSLFRVCPVSVATGC